MDPLEIIVDDGPVCADGVCLPPTAEFPAENADEDQSHNS